METKSSTTPRRGRWPPCLICEKQTLPGNQLILCPQRLHSVHMKCDNKMPPRCGCDWPKESTPKRTRSTSSKAKESTSGSPDKNKEKNRRSKKISAQQQRTNDGVEFSSSASEDEYSERESVVESDEASESPTRRKENTRRAKPRTVTAQLALLAEALDQIPDAVRDLNRRLKKSRAV